MGGPDKTMAATPKNLSEKEAQKVADKIAPQINQLNAALAEAQDAIESQSDKRSENVQAGGCSNSCLLGKANGLVAEISGTLKGVIGILGIGKST